MKICPKCGKQHTKEGIYCSRHCANGRVKTNEVRQKTRETLAKTLLSKGKTMRRSELVKCKTCGKQFVGISGRSFCSKSCQAKFHRDNSLKALELARKKLRENGNLGGYREGSGRAKHGYYKGIYCGSTYELVWLIYQLDNEKPVERFKGELEYDGVKYIPDFIQDGKIIELKGYEDQKSVDRKSEVAKHHGYEVVVLRRENLDKEFAWVREHYQFHDVEELYDDYKPRFTYTCSCCHKDFSRNREILTEVKFCSRQCAGKYAANRLHGTVE